MPEVKKLVPLANFSVTVDPSRIGMFDAVCNIHDVKWECVGRSYVLTVDDETMFSSLYRNLAFAFVDVPEDNPKGVDTNVLRLRLEEELAAL